MQDPPPVRVEWTEKYVELILDRPQRHNALDQAMRDQLVQSIRALIADSQQPPLVLFGNGASFCSGGDLDEFGTTPIGPAGHMVRLTRHLPALIAVVAGRLTVGVHGACIGAGVELSSFARRVVAADDTHFSLPEVQMGLLPGSGGTVSVPRRIGRQRALWLMLTGQQIDADTALAWGLVDDVVPRAQLRDRVRAEQRP